MPAFDLTFDPSKIFDCAYNNTCFAGAAATDSEALHRLCTAVGQFNNATCIALLQILNAIEGLKTQIAHLRR